MNLADAGAAVASATVRVQAAGATSASLVFDVALLRSRVKATAVRARSAQQGQRVSASKPAGAWAGQAAARFRAASLAHAGLAQDTALLRARVRAVGARASKLAA